jgi:hypothetical protein
MAALIEDQNAARQQPARARPAQTTEVPAFGEAKFVAAGQAYA